MPAPPKWQREAPYSIRAPEETGGEVPAQVRLPDPLSLQDAFMMALRANKDVLVTDLRTEADREGIRREKGEFDVVSFAQVSRGRTTIPIAGTPLEEIDESEGFAEVGLRQRVITGTDITLSAANDYRRDVDGSAVIDPSYRPEVRLSVAQDLLRDAGISINRTGISVAENQYEITLQDLRDTAIETLFEVEDAYWDLYFALEDLQVRRRRLENARRLVDVAEAQVEVGISPPLDIVRARSSAAAQETNILNTRDQITRLRHRLLRAMGVIDESLVNPEFELADLPPEQIYDMQAAQALERAFAHRPDLQQALLDVDTRRLFMHFFRNQRLPSLELFGDYLLEGLGDDFDDATEELDGRFNTWTVGLRFEFPIPNRTARSAYQIARLQHRQALWRWRSVYERIVREVGDALSNVRTAEGRIKTARQSRRLAEQVLTAEEKSFSLGRSDSLDVLAAQESLAAAERDEVRALADYATALANLFRAQGTLLERKGVTVTQPQQQ